MHQQDIAGAGAVAQHDGADLDIEKVATREDLPQLQQVRSHASHHDLHATISTHTEANAAQYERFSPHRKIIITTILSLSGLLAPISSTAILSAIPEVAATYNSTGSIINLSNAMYMLFMGFSPCFWGPLSQVYGRRWVRQTLFTPIQIVPMLTSEWFLDMHSCWNALLRLLRRNRTSP